MVMSPISSMEKLVAVLQMGVTAFRTWLVQLLKAGASEWATGKVRSSVMSDGGWDEVKVLVRTLQLSI